MDDLPRGVRVGINPLGDPYPVGLEFIGLSPLVCVRLNFRLG
jgi:hypothetical protein